jgi:hypothetical protein
MVMGYIKPVILFPIGLVNHLSVSEVESILAHELAHVKRHDFILNIIQMVAEALYYYHPCIWYISSRINAERENCCDDLAIAITGNNISYAKTLVKLQDLKISGKLKPALAYAGNKNTFTQRIMRILNQSSAANQYRDKFLALFLVFASLVLGANNWELNRNETVESPEIYFIDDCPQDASDIKYYLDTIPEKNTFHIKKITDEQNVEMEMDNGEVIKLKIDGKDIDKKDYDKYEVIISELQPKKGKDIVTIFPNCDDNLGAVYLYKDLDNEIIRLDSVLGNLEKEKVNIIRNYWTNDNAFAYEELHEAIIDTIEPGVIAKRYPNRFMREKINIDSVFDLLPEKMPKIYFKNFDGNDEEELVFEFNDDIRIDLQNEMEDVIIELENSLNQEEVEIRLKEMKDKLNRKEIEIELRDRDSRLQKERALLDLRKMYAEEEERVNRIDNKIRIYADELEAQVFPEAATELYFGNRGTATVSDKLTQELLEDRLISREEISKIELTGKFLKINGDKQPKNLWMKYKEIYEEFTGLELSKSSKLKFDIDPQNEVQAVNIFSRRRI